MFHDSEHPLYVHPVDALPGTPDRWYHVRLIDVGEYVCYRGFCHDEHLLVRAAVRYATMRGKVFRTYTKPTHQSNFKDLMVQRVA